MAEPEKTSDSSNENDPSNDTGDATQSASGAAETSNDTSGDASSGDENPVTREEFDKIYRRMQAADKRAGDAEAKLREIERKDQSELERAQADLVDAQKQIGQMQEQIARTALENAFLSNNKYTWHDPQDALRLMDMDGVEVKDGKVSGLPPAIEKLAKSKPHLLKRDESEGGSSSSSAASGSANNGRRKGDGKEPPQNYGDRFPALRKHGVGTKS